MMSKLKINDTIMQKSPLYKLRAWEVQAQGLPDDLLGFKDVVFPGVLLLSRRR